MLPKSDRQIKDSMLNVALQTIIKYPPPGLSVPWMTICLASGRWEEVQAKLEELIKKDDKVELLPPESELKRLPDYYGNLELNIDTVLYNGQPLMPLYMDWIDQIQDRINYGLVQEVYFGYVYASYTPGSDYDTFNMGFDVWTDKGTRSIMVVFDINRNFPKEIASCVVETDTEGLFYSKAGMMAHYSFTDNRSDVYNLRLD